MSNILLKKWKPLFSIFIISASIAFIICKWFINPLYKSVAIIYPPNTHANIHLVSAGMRFGYDKEIGEHLEIMNSNFVRNAVMAEFDLIHHYRLNESNPLVKAKLDKMYDSRIALSRTINKSIHVTVLDENPELASEIANKLIEISDHHKSNMIKQNVKLALTSAELTYLEKEKVITLMADSLEIMRLAGESVWNLGEERKSGRYMNYELQYRKELDHYLNYKNRYEELKQLLEDEIPKSYVVSVAEPSVKPASPKKLIISILTGFCAASLYVLLLKLKT